MSPRPGWLEGDGRGFRDVADSDGYPLRIVVHGAGGCCCKRGDRILYTVYSKPVASEFGVESRWAARSRDLPAKSVTRGLNAGGKGLSEERGVVSANQWFPKAEGELVEEVIGLGRCGKTLTVLTVKE